MYESPIMMFADNVCKQIVEERENAIFATIKEQTQLDIDKNELVRALNYDRDQYRKGYKDGSRNLAESQIIDWMVDYIREHDIKSLMELVMQAIDKEQEN